MSAHHNGHAIPNGTGFETFDGEVVKVRVTHHHPIDDIEPEPLRACEPKAAALRYLSGHDGRTLEAIASDLGISKQRLGFVVCQIADRLGIPTAAPGRRRSKRKSAAPLAERDANLTKASEVNGSEGA